ncbi:rod-binding protein [Acetobacter sp.]|jgi:Rod binding domain-containing protein|uniref:rod-binding protein n=1 Tax=Acetobacter sp. TaxID=440 RepID=UPI0025C6B632|nr:rod-binding protein [Acetobacter sp.]MCH4090432.1 rod-binding protein [Acetobacter sp.]MCI1299126.1 rod-binding protein [Acetobacter sp.]MCI1315673.1 rod-binding protein [Acetobacter sp.]
MSNEIKNVAAPGYGVQGATPTKAVDPKIWKTATDFEAMTVGQMLQPMFDTIDTSKGFFGGGVGESSFRPMLTTEMSKQIEKNGGLGLAPAVYHQMLEMQEKGSGK